MAVYTPVEFSIPTGLDELGLKLGMNRLESESLGDYRRRLLLEARDRSGPTEEQFIRSLGRKVGKFDTEVFEIDLILDGNSDPLAVDAYIEITSTHLRVYEDFTNKILDFEVDLTNRTTGWFLREVNTAFTASTFFSIVVKDLNHTFKRANKLRFENTNKVVQGEYLFRSRVTKFKQPLLIDIHFSDLSTFRNSVATKALVVADGDYHVDKRNGVVFSHGFAAGFAVYTHRAFPFKMYHQAVRAFPYNDPDVVFATHDTLTSDTTGLSVNTNLNSHGARLADIVYDVHPLTWGD